MPDALRRQGRPRSCPRTHGSADAHPRREISPPLGELRRRSTRPGCVQSGDRLETERPLTQTIAMPIESACGSRAVARSATVAGSKSTRSAKALGFDPTRARTIRRWPPLGRSSCGWPPPGSGSPRSRTKRPRTRGKEPNPRGCVPSSSPSVQKLIHGQAITVDVGLLHARGDDAFDVDLLVHRAPCAAQGFRFPDEIHQRRRRIGAAQHRDLAQGLTGERGRSEDRDKHVLGAASSSTAKSAACRSSKSRSGNITVRVDCQ